MSICVWLWILCFAVRLSTQECRFKEVTTRRRFEVFCTNTTPENFFYDFFANDRQCRFGYNLTITKSDFVHIHSFLAPCPFLQHLSLTNSSVELIEDWAFEDLQDISHLDLSHNRLLNVSFVKTLPRGIKELVLSDNSFEVVYNVFGGMYNLNLLDLSDCNINFIDSNSFSSLTRPLSISIRNNKLASFDVDFPDEFTLKLDLSFNNLACLNNDKFRRIYFNKIDVSHNKIENISDISCQDCGYSYYRRSIPYVDLSFNKLNNIKLLHSFSGVKLENLNLSNSNIDSTFDFEILRSVKDTLDLSNNNLGVLTPSIFGSSVRIGRFVLSNSSITRISERTFTDFHVDVLNISSNLMTELKDFTFVKSFTNVLDLSKCLIRTIRGKAFYDLDVRTLNLSHNQLTHIGETTFQNLKSVYKIDLSFNSINNLDDDLFQNCSWLKILDLSNSKIEIIQSKAFAGPKLLELYLQNNLITRIDFQTSVERVLNLKNNTFRNFDFSFLANASANVVLLSDNNMTELFNNSVPGAVLEIDLSNSKIYTINVNAFWGISKVERLNLSNNCLVEIVPRTFFSLKKLKRLDLSGNKLVAFSKNAFPFGNRLEQLGISFFDTNIQRDTFITFNSLKALNISRSRIAVLEENCFKGLIRLDNLRLEDVDIKQITPGAFKGLSNLKGADFRTLFKNIDSIKSQTFVGLPKLDTLNITHLQIWSLEAKAFNGLTNLETLLLNNNKLDKIANNTFLGLNSLKFLNLSSNYISQLDPQAFAGLLNLTEISLSDNNLSKLVLGTFQEFPNLRVLDLHKNSINKILTGIFSNLKSLVELDLSYNNITKLKMENLMPLTALSRLELTGNHLIQMSHLDLIKSLTQLKFVGINENKWKCDNLATMLIAFQNYSIDWVSTNAMTLTHENIDGIKCYDICKFFYCVEEEETLYSPKKH